jgi:NADH-quinone oxidoreductase subunit K
MITVGFLLAFSFSVLIVGLIGLCINRKNLVLVLVSLEIILLASGINFVGFSYFSDNIEGQIMAMFVLSIAACEVAIGLTLLTLHFKSSGTIEIDDISKVKDI